MEKSSKLLFKTSLTYSSHRLSLNLYLGHMGLYCYEIYIFLDLFKTIIHLNKE